MRAGVQFDAQELIDRRSEPVCFGRAFTHFGIVRTQFEFDTHCHRPPARLCGFAPITADSSRFRAELPTILLARLLCYVGHDDCF